MVINTGKGGPKITAPACKPEPGLLIFTPADSKVHQNDAC